MSWSAEQLRILRAMGHEPMQLAQKPGSKSTFQNGKVDSDPGFRAVLQAAIARAAGGGDLSALALDLERLRREPALKRALWPQLRALRRGH